MKQARILLLDLNPTCELGKTLREILESSDSLNAQLRQEFIDVSKSTFSNKNLAKILSHFTPDMIFVVLCPNILNQTGKLFQFIQSMRKEGLEIPTLAVMETNQPDKIFELIKFGATDFITPPLQAIEIIPRVWRLLEQAHQEDRLTHNLKQKLGLKQLIGESSTFLSEIKKIPLIAKCNANVLICGETGTGKEVCARAIHYLSLKTDKPFIPVNCGAIPLELMENELFGHIRGAFTGASTSQPGLIQEADGGTLFLDEIGCLSLPAQAKLLRFLQEKEYKPLGSPKVRQGDIRIIAAANTDLEAGVKEGKFRQDLYYRLNIIPLKLPPLRERREDIPLLACHFLARYANEFNKPVTNFSLNAMQALMLYDWPGNVRELEHTIQRAVVLSKQTTLQKADIVLPHLESTPHEVSFQEAKTKVIEQFEKAYIQELLVTHGGNITKAAQAAKKNRRAFWQLMRKYGITTTKDKRSLKMP